MLLPDMGEMTIVLVNHNGVETFAKTEFGFRLPRNQNGRGTKAPNIIA